MIQNKAKNIARNAIKRYYQGWLVPREEKTMAVDLRTRQHALRGENGRG